MSQEILTALSSSLETGFGAKLETGGDMPVIHVERQKVLELSKFLCHDERFEFKHCSGVTAYDDFPAKPRFTAVYHLYSYKLHLRIRVKASVPEEDAVVPSTVSVWATNNFHERETFDMFGIRFSGHPDLRRLLMPENFKHYPLRKDFPLEGIEPDRLYREWEQGRQK